MAGRCGGKGEEDCRFFSIDFPSSEEELFLRRRTMVHLLFPFSISFSFFLFFSVPAPESEEKRCYESHFLTPSFSFLFLFFLFFFFSFYPRTERERESVVFSRPPPIFLSFFLSCSERGDAWRTSWHLDFFYKFLQLE